MRDKRTITWYIFIFIFSESFIGSTTNFFILNRETKIIGLGGNEVVQGEMQKHDEIFRIICNGRIWEQRSVNNSKLYDVDHHHDRGGIMVVEAEEETLDCGKPVNSTYYDDLIGIANRNVHPNVPEPEISYIFFSKKDTTSSHKTFDVDALEKRLRKAKREKPKSVQLYNQIGNFWRIKGDARQSIECFRRALAVSPTNAEVLLNLARVLFNLNFLDDAIYLTRKSLEVHPVDKSPWKQYLTLGEIFKAYGHFQESQIHLRHALELAPEHMGVKQALLDIENIPSTTLHAYTILIILFLAMGVLLVVISSTDASSSQLSESSSSSSSSNQRHLNKFLSRSQHKVFRNIKCRK